MFIFMITMIVIVVMMVIMIELGSKMILKAARAIMMSNMKLLMNEHECDDGRKGLRVELVTIRKIKMGTVF